MKWHRVPMSEVLARAELNRRTDDGHVFYANSIVSCCIANCLPLAIGIDADADGSPPADSGYAFVWWFDSELVVEWYGGGAVVA